MLIAMLEAGRRDFLSALDLPHPVVRRGGWSVLEIVEHVATVEDRYLEWIRFGAEVPPPRDSGREMRLFTTVRSRLQRVEAAEAVWPAGRLRSLEQARTEFEEVRARTLDTARELVDSLYSRGARHPFFGPVNGVELIYLMDAHARRHADQIRECAGFDAT